MSACAFRRRQLGRYVYSRASGVANAHTRFIMLKIIFAFRRSRATQQRGASLARGATRVCVVCGASEVARPSLSPMINGRVAMSPMPCRCCASYAAICRCEIRRFTMAGYQFYSPRLRPGLMFIA